MRRWYLGLSPERRALVPQLAFGLVLLVTTTVVFVQVALIRP